MTKAVRGSSQSLQASPKLGYGHFLLHPFSFINHLIIRSYILYPEIQKTLNKYQIKKRTLKQQCVKLRSGLNRLAKGSNCELLWAQY